MDINTTSQMEHIITTYIYIRCNGDLGPEERMSKTPLVMKNIKDIILHSHVHGMNHTRVYQVLPFSDSGQRG